MHRKLPSELIHTTDNAMKNIPRLNWFWALLIIFFCTALIGTAIEALYNAFGLNWSDLLRRIAIGLLSMLLILCLTYLYRRIIGSIKRHYYRQSPFYIIDHSQSQLEQAMLEIAKEKRNITRQNQIIEEKYARQEMPSQRLQRIVHKRRAFFKLRLKELDSLENQVKTRHAELSQYREELILLELFQNDPDFEYLEVLEHKTTDLISSITTTLKVDLDFKIIERTSNLNYTAFD